MVSRIEPKLHLMGSAVVFSEFKRQERCSFVPLSRLLCKL